jgi:hypothetical protein
MGFQLIMSLNESPDRDLMGGNDPRRYIQKMIEDFRIPGRDALAECLLAAPGEYPPVWDSAIFLSTEQSKGFYSDIFQFWVRAFFCFVEDTRTGSMFHDIIPFIVCREISSEEFRRHFFELLHERRADESFTERQAYPETRVELEKRSFWHPYIVLERPNIKSSVAYSDGEYVTYFVAGSPGRLSFRK